MSKKVNKKAILQVLAERKLPASFKLEDICFPEQLAFIRDPAPFVTASCSRRAGKTEVCALDLISTAIQFQGVNCMYITLSRANAERIVWAKLREINETYKLGGEVNLSKLTITFPNKSVIYLSGCKDKGELDNYRGMAFKLVYIDEVQSFKSFIQELIDDVLGPSLADHSGALKLIGTPAPLCTGFFWDTLQSDVYSHHKWTFFNNPFIEIKSGKTHLQVLDRELKRRGVTAEEPSVRREWFGEWTNDSNALVYQYNKTLNHYDDLPELTDYVIGVDLGSNAKGRDKDAIAIIGWHKNKKEVYLVEEFIGKEEGITPLVEKLSEYIKAYNPLKVVMDTGGLGRKIADELRKRHALPIVAAEKTRKFEFIALLNDAMRTKVFHAPSDSRFAGDAYVVQYDYNKCTQDKLVIKSEPHSDIADAVLYSFREALAWLSKPAKTMVNLRDPQEWLKHSQSLMEESLQKQIEQQQAHENESDFWSIQDQGLDDNPLQYYLNKRK